MKKIIVLILFLFLLSLPFSVAEEGDLEGLDVGVMNEEIKISAGVTPDSVLYGFDKAIDRLRLSLALTRVKKSQLALKIAEERLQEVRTMVELNKQKEANLAEIEHNKLIDLVEMELPDVTDDETDKDVQDLEERLEWHREKVIKIKERILTQQKEKMTPEQIEHLNNVFEKIEDRVDNSRLNLLNKQKIKLEKLEEKEVRVEERLEEKKVKLVGVSERTEENLANKLEEQKRKLEEKRNQILVRLGQQKSEIIDRDYSGDESKDVVGE